KEVAVRFFFQAEDGIRDFHVTGVQTCALPISWMDGPCFASFSRERRIERDTRTGMEKAFGRAWIPAGARHMVRDGPRFVCWDWRSEERRVGKEWRARCEAADHLGW